RDARCVAQLDREGGDERRLLGRLGDGGVAGGEGGGGRADEDGEGEVPRADRGEGAAAVKAQQVLLAGGAGKGVRGGEQCPGFGRVEAEEIDRLSQFQHRVPEGLSGFALAEGE